MTDRVKFYLPCINYQNTRRTTNGFLIEDMCEVLQRAFGRKYGTWVGLANSNRDGFYIICRPSQFARFIIYRSQLGTGHNGIRNLEAQLFMPKKERDPYTAMSEKFMISRNTMSNIIEFLGMDTEMLKEIVGPKGPACSIDVSMEDGNI